MLLYGGENNMKKRFLGIICMMYTIMISYICLTNQLKNFLAPSLQLYIKLSIIPLLLISLVLCLNNKIEYKFKISDIILLLPIIMLLLTQDGRLTTTFANNRLLSTTKNNQKEEVLKESEKEIKEEQQQEQTPKEEISTEKIDFTNPYFNVIDESYDSLANYLTYEPNAKKYIGKTIRVRGFSLLEAPFLKKGYFAIGKYSITCCVADSSFIGFIAKYDITKIKKDTWYEIEGILEQDKDNTNTDILVVKIINIKEIDGKEEEQYVYPCYAYDNGSCKEIQKYNLTD